MCRPLHPMLYATILLFALVAPGAAVAQDRAAGAPPFALYLAEGAGDYQAVDPGSLANLAKGKPLPTVGDYPHLAVSADGSTSVSVVPALGTSGNRLTVHDGVFAADRLTIVPREAVFHPRLSADGARLVVEPSTICGPSGCNARTWYTYDTQTGALISKTATDLTNPVWPDMLGPAADRLYVPHCERAAGVDAGPWPLWIAMFDLDTGQAIDRMLVPGAMAGSWQAESIGDTYVGETHMPAIALSPDGATIAVVDAAMKRLTLIETSMLDVVATHAIHEHESIADRLFDWLGIAPRSAAAKVSRGRTMSAAFATDGRHLYLTGFETDVRDTAGEIDGRGIGLMRIDIDSGMITASVLDGLDADLITPAPDGDSIYVIRSTVPWWTYGGQGAGRLLLERRDAVTLDVLAERAMSDWAKVMIIPANVIPRLP